MKVSPARRDSGDSTKDSLPAVLALHEELVDSTFEDIDGLSLRILLREIMLRRQSKGHLGKLIFLRQPL